MPTEAALGSLSDDEPVAMKAWSTISVGRKMTAEVALFCCGRMFSTINTAGGQAQFASSSLTRFGSFGTRRPKRRRAIICYNHEKAREAILKPQTCASKRVPARNVSFRTRVHYETSCSPKESAAKRQRVP